MKKLHTSGKKNETGVLTMGELAKVLHVTRKTIENWHYRHELPVIKKKVKDIKTFYLIDHKAFWGWAFTHQERIDFSKIEKDSIPPEPKWVDILRHQERVIESDYYRPWTEEEKSKILELVNEGKTFEEIGLKIHRTTVSVERKYNQLMDDIDHNNSSI